MSSKDASEPNRQRRTIKVEKLQSTTAEVNNFQDSKHLKLTTDSAKAAKIFRYDEDEASRRDASSDLEIHKTVCSELRQVMDRIKELKKGGIEGSSAELEDLRVHGILQFVSLKKLNRIAHFRSKKVRDSTNEAKLKVDQHHLKLQNLLYEVAHLEKEINKCLQFKSKDEEVSLVPVEQFYKEASADIAKPKVTRGDEHQLKLARLHWELEQRKRLSVQLKQAAGLKDHIMSDIKTKKEFLDDLQPKLNNILQATKPVQDQLEMHIDVVREQQRTASYLPSPLYVLYVQATAYSQARDENLTVNIDGDVELARNMEQAPVIIDDDNDDDVDEQDKSKDVGRRRSTSQHHRTHNLLHKHPLSVGISIKCPDGSQLSLTFHYIMSLSIVTVCVKLSTSETVSSISAGDLLVADNVLSCLYADDDGMSSPNPSNTYMAALGEFSKYVSEVGRPYRWVQWLCGLQFLASDPQKAEVSVSACHMADVVQRLRQRVLNRLALQKLFAALELCQIPVTSECVSLYPAKIASRLVEWKRSTYQDFSACHYTQRFIELGLVRASDSMFFVANVQRGNVVMTAQIVVGADYPNTSPLLALSLHRPSTVPSTALNDDAIRDMELEVNMCDSEMFTANAECGKLMLTDQLQRLLVCFDVYLEMLSVTTGSSEFSQDRICSRITRGRNRARPFQYNSQLGFFTQR